MALNPNEVTPTMTIIATTIATLLRFIVPVSCLGGCLRKCLWETSLYGCEQESLSVQLLVSRLTGNLKIHFTDYRVNRELATDLG